uniref:Uncharacterized protein n=1 Tax=Kalanchoe fedtschenkoi TaxID=63787 RepID=A0A7N1A7E0_KALFE
MGTKVQYKSSLPGYRPMGDLNDDSNSGTWPIYYGDKPSSNGQFNDPYLQRTIADTYFGYQAEAVKQKMLEHEAIFKGQLYELHRLYRVQRDLMDELKMNELHKQSMAIETSISSCSASQRQEAQRWHTSSAFPPLSSSSAKPAILGAKEFNSAPSFLSKGPENGLVSPSNAGSSKDCEVEILECRPSKARRKFNLELRADEYIDVEEPNCSSERRPDISSYPSDGSRDNPPSSSAKMFVGEVIKIDSRSDGARQNYGSLADLNEKIQVQESSSLNFVGCDSNFRSNQQLSSMSQVQTFHQEFRHDSHHRRDDNRSRNMHMFSKENWSWSHMPESARSKGQATAFSQNSLSEKISLFNKGQDESHFQTNQIKAEYWKERSEGGPRHSGSGIDFLNRLSNPLQSDKSFSTLMAPWDKSGRCLAQTSATAEMSHPCFNSTSTLPQGFQSSSRAASILGQVWQINSDSGRDSTHLNGFYRGSCAGSGPARCPTSVSDHLNRSSSSHAAYGLSFGQNGLVNLKGLNGVNARSAKGIDLNVVSVCDSHDAVEDARVDGPHQDHVSGLPWLKSGTGSKNDMIQSSNSGATTQIGGSASSAYDTESKPAAKRIMGVPIFRECQASSRRSSLSKEEEMEKKRGVRDFDMNLPCESDENKDTGTHGVGGRNLIDLNMCLTEDEAAVTGLSPGSHSGKRMIRDFDLEAPGESEEEELVRSKQQKPGNSDEDLVTVAAVAIAGISSGGKLTLAETPAQEATPDALKWFSDVISSCADDADKVRQDESGENCTDDSESMDYFEYMTLQLPETKEEDYLPDYPKAPEPEERTGAGPFTTRTRKGFCTNSLPRNKAWKNIMKRKHSKPSYRNKANTLMNSITPTRGISSNWATSALNRRQGVAESKVPKNSSQGLHFHHDTQIKDVRDGEGGRIADQAHQSASS